MTKEKLLARKAEAERSKEELIARVNVINGVISECDYWISELEKPEPAPE